jgi:hypothetical protein
MESGRKLNKLNQLFDSGKISKSKQPNQTEQNVGCKIRYIHSCSTIMKRNIYMTACTLFFKKKLIKKCSVYNKLICKYKN